MFSKRVFLDYASTTPVDKSVFKKMKPFFSDKFENPSALYKEAVYVKREVESARETVSRICGVRDSEVLFTSGGTESNNIAIQGIAKKFQLNKGNLKPKIITTNIEHPSVLKVCEELEKFGVDAVFLKVNKKGFVNIEDVVRNLDENVVLVSIIMANNEIGTIEPIRRISSEIKKFKNKIGRRFDEFPFLHTDASQASNYLDVNLDKVGADMMTLDASKIYGPKGVGVLVKKHYVEIEKIYLGGGQEFETRPGTENVPSIVGMAEALRISEERREKEFERMADLQKYFFERIKKEIPEAKINGDIDNRLPNNINICVQGLNSEFAVIQLDERGICASATTACQSINSESRSYVVDALGDNCGASSLRFTMGRKTSKKDIDLTIKALIDIIKKHE